MSYRLSHHPADGTQHPVPNRLSGGSPENPLWNNDPFWNQRRVLVLDCPTALGTALARQFATTTARVTGFFQHRGTSHTAFEQLLVLRGTAHATRLRALLSVGEFEAVFVAADSPTTSRLLTQELLAACASVCQPVLLVVPQYGALHLRVTIPHASPVRLLRVGLPELIGPYSRGDGWLDQAFQMAAQGWPVPRPPAPDTPICDAESAAEQLVACARELLADTELLRDPAVWDRTIRPIGTLQDVYTLLVPSGPVLPPAPPLALQSAVATTLAWYRAQATRPGPSLHRAA